MAIPHAQPGDIIDVHPLGEALPDTKTHALFKIRGVELVRVVMRKGKAIPEHKTSGEIVVQCLEGKIALKAMNTMKTLAAGQMLYLAGGEPHSVECIEDASFLLTILLGS
jgi:quercetin dioxygenase-like cupin family protein